MSRKTNRLKNRLRIERERNVKVAAVQKVRSEALAAAADKLAQARAKLADEQARLNRSVALRIRVERVFDRPYGDLWQLVIRLYPEEFKILHYQAQTGPQNVTAFAYQRGMEAGRQIAKVIEQCISGDIKKWEGL